MSEEQEWYFISVVDGQQYGPYTAEQLEHYTAAGSITRETLVWTDSLDDWIPASNVEGLFPEQTAIHRPQLLTGAAAQAAHPLGAAMQTPVPYRQPVATAYPQQMVPPQQVRPGMIPSSMPGTTPVAALAAAPASPFPHPVPAGYPLGPQIIPPGEPFHSTGAMKASFGLLLTLTVLGILALVGAVVAAGGRMLFFVSSGSQSGEDALEALGQSLSLFIGALVVGVIFLLIYRIMTIVYLYRAWNAVQAGRVRCSPGKAIGFLFIPLFNLYWFFIAYLGLAKDWNRVMASHPNLAQAPRMSEGLFTTFCIMIVVSALLYLIPASVMKGAIGAIVAITVLARLVLEFVVYFMICRGVNFMGRLHLMTIQAQQPGVGLRLY